MHKVIGINDYDLFVSHRIQDRRGRLLLNTLIKRLNFLQISFAK